MGLKIKAIEDFPSQTCGSNNDTQCNNTFTATNMRYYPANKLNCGDERAWLLEFDKSKVNQMI
jgi:hypothetical protein